MSWEYLHLVTHPFPVVLALVGSAAGLCGWAGGREALERYGILSLLLAGAAAIPAYFTGIAAADTAAARTFVEPSLVQTHRTWATWTTVALVTVGAFAAFSLWQPSDRRLRRFVLVTGLAAACLLAWTSWLGGHIVHGEPGGEAGGIGAAPGERPPGAVVSETYRYGDRRGPVRAHREAKEEERPCTASPTRHTPAVPTSRVSA